MGVKYKKLVDTLEVQIRHDPFGWDPEKINLPDIFKDRPDLKNKFLMRMSVLVEKAKAELDKDGVSPLSNSAAAMPTPSPSLGSQSIPSAVPQNDAPSSLKGR